MERIQDDVNEVQKILTTCQVAIGQHEERLKALQDNMKRQNGLLDDVKKGVDTVAKKVDAVGLSLANRINEIERSSIKRDTTAERCSLGRSTASDLATTKDIALLREEFLTQQSKAQSTLLWKVISAVSAMAFLFFVVILTIMTHTFGGLP